MRLLPGGAPAVKDLPILSVRGLRKSFPIGRGWAREAGELEARLRGRGIVNPTMDTGRDVKYRSETLTGLRIVGTTEKQSLVASAQPETGRFLNEFDVTYKKNVCVIGTDVRDGLFGSANPINQFIHIGRTKFRVIGVMEKQGGSFFGGGFRAARALADDVARVLVDAEPEWVHYDELYRTGITGNLRTR